MPTSPDLFDQWAAAAPPEPVPAPAEPTASDATPEPAPAVTPLPLRRALQELLKTGLLEQTSKPRLFQQIASDTARTNALLEPLDLQVRVDDLRGLAYVAVAPGWEAEDAEDDEWTHPLVRRQRLTLEQSLLLAVLRREFLQREQEGGLGVAVQLGLDGLLAQLEIYLGATGSQMQDRKRLLELLEKLRAHGVVSEVDAQDQLTIRPMIVHLANPENLQGLLAHLRGLGQAGESTP